MKSLLLAMILATLGQTAQARSRDLPYVDDLSLIDLRDDAATIGRTYSYPGLGGTEGVPSPDCLMLVFGGDQLDHPENGIEKLMDAINVYDGDDILFPGTGHRELNTLEPKRIGNYLVYYFKDLSKFLTGVRVEAKNGKALKRVVAAVGFKGPVALQVFRGCRVLPAEL